MWSRLTSNKLNSQGNIEILIFLSYRPSFLYSFKSMEILFVCLSALLYGSDVLVMRSPFGTVNYSFWIYLFSQSLECQFSPPTRRKMNWSLRLSQKAKVLKNEAESSRHKQAGPEAVPASQVAAAGFLQKELTEKENN